MNTHVLCPILLYPVTYGILACWKGSIASWNLVIYIPIWSANELCSYFTSSLDMAKKFQIDTLFDRTACLLDNEVLGRGLLRMEEGLALMHMCTEY